MLRTRHICFRQLNYFFKLGCGTSDNLLLTQRHLARERQKTREREREKEGECDLFE